MKTGLDTYRDMENSGFMRQTCGSVLKRKYARLHVFRHSIDSTIYYDFISFFYDFIFLTMLTLNWIN